MSTLDADSRRVKSEIDDEALMTAVRDAECEDSFCALAERWQHPIFSLCYRMVSCSADAEDLTQDVFCNLFKKRQAYRIEAKFSTYLWQIALNRCRDFLRQKTRIDRRQKNFQNEFREASFDPSSQIDARDQITHALNQIPENYREVLVLKHFQGLSFRQIATVAGIPIGTAASRMSKAMELMREILEKGSLK